MPLTKAQLRTLAKLERKGYEIRHLSDSGHPVLCLQEKGIWIELLTTGEYRPA